jgi:hypothetical protein
MLPFRRYQRNGFLFRLGVTVAVAGAFFAGALCGDSYAVSKKATLQKTYSSSEEAAKALAAAVKAGDQAELLTILGPGAKQILSSGDEVADKAARERFVQAYEAKNRVVPESDRKAVLEVGDDAWPLPIPIVNTGKAWRFDTAAGKQEILNRRIGRNELSTIQVCLAYFDAQREYALKDRGAGIQFAQKFASEPGKKDGLYWEAAAGEEQSPLGPFAAQAKSEGYTKKKSGERTPYHGYFFKILTAQGKNATGGAYSYVVNGKMIGGFALVAWPAEYGTSGIMTFIVNHEGVVYQKNLGKNTESAAVHMKAFDPDKSWGKVADKDIEAFGKAGAASQ